MYKALLHFSERRYTQPILNYFSTYLSLALFSDSISAQNIVLFINLAIFMIWQLILSDLYRYCGNTTFKSFIRNYFFNRGFNFSVWLRLASQKSILGKLSYPIFYYKKKKYGIDIHCTTQIGYGLYIGHGGPLVVNPTTIIGHNVNLSQFTTIGANGGKQAAYIGDNVYIGPNVCIIDDVKIGDNATIGAGSVVTKDIPDNATAVGNYAKVIHYNNAGHAVNRRWPIK